MRGESGTAAYQVLQGPLFEAQTIKQPVQTPRALHPAPTQVVAPCVVGELREGSVEKDRLSVIYTTAPKTYIENDALALHFR